MRLLVASVDFFPNMGGISMMTHHLANALADLGADTELLAPKGCKIPDGLEARYRLHEDKRAVVANCEGDDWLNGELPRISRLVSNLHASVPFDRLIALHPTYYGQAFRHLEDLIGVPSTVFIHGFELRSQMLLRTYWQDFRKQCAGIRPTIKSEILNTVRNVDEVAVNSDYTASLVRKAGRRGSTPVTGCGIELDADRFALPNSAQARARAKSEAKVRLGLDPDKPLFGTLNRLVPSKNPHMILHALKHLPHMQGVIIGEGPQRTNLTHLAQELGVADRLQLPGRVNEEEKWQWLQAMDAFCLLSSQQRTGQVEGFGIVLLEAAAAGTPVIASRSGGIPYVIRDNIDGTLIEPGNISDLVAAIALLIQQDGSAKSHVDALRKRIEKEFNWPFIASKLLNRWNA